MITIAHSLRLILSNIAQTAQDAKRNEKDITLVAVSKTHPPSLIEEAIQEGHRVFGENRVQEAKQKWPELQRKYPDIELHLIGPLQTNKVPDALALFDVIETIDREKLAKEISKELIKKPKNLTCYIQVNIGDEPQKAGIPPEEADEFIRLCKDELKLPITGLMCIPPVDEDPTPHFQLLKAIAKRNHLSILSMGMSNDYPEAIKVGATHIRVGTAIFGTRDIN